MGVVERERGGGENVAAGIRREGGGKELAPTRVKEFVKKIIVQAREKARGHRRQKVQIVWNFIGEVNLPNDSQVIERQRKGRTA